MTRDEWRRLCEKTPKGNSGQPRPFWTSLELQVETLSDGRKVIMRQKGHTFRWGPTVGYRKKMRQQVRMGSANQP